MGIARLVDEMVPPDPATAVQHPMSTPAPLPAGLPRLASPVERRVGPAMTTRRRMAQLAALGLALVGYWLPWLAVSPAALRLNGYELSEWVTFLPGVRDGTLPLSRLLFLMPLVCLAVLLALAASRLAEAATHLYLGRRAATDRARARPRPRNGLSALLPVDGLADWALMAWGWSAPWWRSHRIPTCSLPMPTPEYQAQLFVALLSVVALLLVALSARPGQGHRPDRPGWRRRRGGGVGAARRPANGLRFAWRILAHRAGWPAHADGFRGAGLAGVGPALHPARLSRPSGRASPGCDFPARPPV